MNEIVFLRHGRALSVMEAGVASDSERPLSTSGEQDALEAARHLKESGFAPSLIISSPFRRADRTAEIAAAVFPSAGRKTDPALSDGPADAVLDLAERAAAAGTVLIVGHMPLLGAAAGALLSAPPLDLSPAGFVRLKPADGAAPGSLVELYSPGGRRV